MEVIRRKIKVYTPGKQYTGEVDVPNSSLRTTDLFNSANLFWKDPTEKHFNDVLLMYDVTLSIAGILDFQQFSRVQVRQPNIIFFHDNFKTMGSMKEKKRADTLKKITREEKKNINLITQLRASSFFDISGSFYGLFKSKSIQKYIPLNDVTMYEIIKQQDKWAKKKIHLPSSFVAVNTNHIESCVFS